MKRVTKGVIGILLTLSFLIIVLIYGELNAPYTKIISLNWNIKLPNSGKQIYSANSKSSFLGDGERYHIFEYKNNNDVISSLSWEGGKNQDIESSAAKVLSALNVTQNNMPNLKDNYRYYTRTKDDSSKIYLIFDTELKKLYVIEDIL